MPDRVFRIHATFFVTASDEYQADSAFDAFLETAIPVDDVRFSSSTRTEEIGVDRDLTRWRGVAKPKGPARMPELEIDDELGL